MAGPEEKGWEMTLMLDVPRLWLHDYVSLFYRIAAAALCQILQQLQVRLLSAGYGTDNGPDTV